MTPEIDVLLETIKSLSLKEALALLVSEKILEFTGEGLSKIKKVIQDKYNEGKYAFVPDKEEAQKLMQFSGDPNYKQLRLLVPHYRYLNIIRTGLLIDYYHRRDKAGDRERVTKIKEQIWNRPNGSYLVKVVNLPAVPFFSVILGHLYELKRANYSEMQLEASFDEILAFWEASSKFVKNEDSEGDIISFCNAVMGRSKPALFLLGMRSAARKIEVAIEKLKEEGSLEKYGYEYRIIKSEEGNHPRIEVTLSRKLPQVYPA